MVNLYSSGYQGSGLFENIINYALVDVKFNRTHNISTEFTEKNIYLFRDPRDTFFSILECNNILAFDNKITKEKETYSFDRLISYMENIWKPMYDKLHGNSKVFSIQYESIFLNYKKFLNDVSVYLNVPIKNEEESIWFYKNGSYYNRRIFFYKCFMTRRENELFSEKYRKYINELNNNEIWYKN
jgi:hypothetical protein